MFERFSLVRCEDAIPGQSSNSESSSFHPYLASIRGIVGNYQDDKDILTTGLVFNDKTLNLYKNSFLYKQSIHEFKRGGENFKVKMGLMIRPLPGKPYPQNDQYLT